jgi:YVTN family beta-propeller protein
MRKSIIARLLPPLGVALCLLQGGCSTGGKKQLALLANPEAVGRVAEDRYVTSTGQWLTPAGRQVELPGMRPQALALSPDGRWLATAGQKNILAVIDTATGEVLQKLSLATKKTNATAKVQASTNLVRALPPRLAAPRRIRGRANASGTGAQMSFTGLTFSPDGQHIYLSAAGGSVRVFTVTSNEVAKTPVAFRLPETRAPKQKTEIPAGLAFSEDGQRLYVVGNLGNRLHELDAATGKSLRYWGVGVAPYDVVLVGNKAYVSNEGGRRPKTNDVTAPAGKGTTVRVDPVRFIPNEGTVTVIDLAANVVKTEIKVELHASALAVSPNKKYVVVANTGSDTLSVIDTKTDTVVEKIWARQTPADLFGAQPNALAFDPTGRQLFVCNGTQNAVAVVHFEPEEKASKVTGMIPVGWFPGAVLFDARRKALCVANIRGLGALREFKPGAKVNYNSKNFFGTVSLVPLPSEKEMPGLTETVLRNMRHPKLAEASLPARPDQPPRPVPERVGEPSLFKHVIYVIKENRSYDQVLGDMKEGDGNASLCIFGEKFTPNQHELARQFILLDNTYCAGVQSADGHQWTDSAMANSYIEREVSSDFPRSYPGGKEEDGLDALAWASSGFLWDNALAHGKTFRNYGEWMISQAEWRNKKAHKGNPAWRDFWKDYLQCSNVTRLASKPGIKSLAKYSLTNTVGWDLHVPDVMRAAAFIKELKRFETDGGFPDLIFLFLPNDHTGGTRDKFPTPGAQVADNDLALGQVVEALSHSKFWADTCLFAIEDDPQAGWDHVSGYRTTCFVASPYTKRRQTIRTQYNQTSLIRTIELILGLPPMNQMDATAAPMSDCFTATADLTPFTCVPNRVPLNTINPEPRKIGDRTLRRDAIVSNRLPLDEVDRCPEDVLNRILWHAMKGPDVPYPDWAVKPVEDID